MVKTPSLKRVLEQAINQFGEGILLIPELGNWQEKKLDIISTGSRAIDEATGIGGLPRGRIVEILGQESSGKSTLVLHAIANAQAQGLNCALIDTEHSLDKSRAENLGVDFMKLAISQPSNGEEALDLMDFLIRTGKFGLVALDSVAALTPRAEIEGDMNDAVMGVQARNMGKALRRIVAPADKYNVLVIFTNQIRQKIGGFGYGPQETTSGGNALKFFASLRIDMRRTKFNKKGGVVVTSSHKVTIKKNKLAPPMRVVNLDIGTYGFIDKIQEGEEADEV